MPLPRQLFGRRIADALSSLIAQKHRTAKEVARAYGIDPATAENLRKGHLSVPTLDKAIASDGWDLWMSLGEAVIGQPYDQHLEQRIEETRRVQDRIAAQRRRVEAFKTARASQHHHLDGRPGA